MSMMHLLSDDVRRDPYPVYEQLRSSSPVLRDPQSDLWMIFDYEGVKRALHDHDAFRSIVAPQTARTSEWLVFSDPPRHTKLRAILLRAFTPRVIASLEPRIRELSRELLNPTLGRGEMDLVADFAVPLPLLVIAEMLGAPAADQPRFKRWSDVIMALGYTLSGGEEAARVHREFSAVTAAIVAPSAADALR